MFYTHISSVFVLQFFQVSVLSWFVCVICCLLVKPFRFWLNNDFCVRVCICVFPFIYLYTIVLVDWKCTTFAGVAMYRMTL